MPLWFLVSNYCAFVLTPLTIKFIPCLSRQQSERLIFDGIKSPNLSRIEIEPWCTIEIDIISGISEGSYFMEDIFGWHLDPTPFEICSETLNLPDLFLSKFYWHTIAWNWDNLDILSVRSLCNAFANLTNWTSCILALQSLRHAYYLIDLCIVDGLF